MQGFPGTKILLTQGIHNGGNDSHKRQSQQQQQKIICQIVARHKYDQSISQKIFCQDFAI